MQRAKRWNIAPLDPDAGELAGRLKTSPLIAQILLNRGVRDPDACRDFLTPSLKLLHDPALIWNLTAASERIAQAIRDKQRIAIYGDYDVDGITATSILWHAIRCLGGTAEFYIPHRIEEGYGLNADAIAQLCDNGVQLIISVDCGVTAIEPALVARSRGVDLIITDHHEWRHQEGSTDPLLPDCHGVVHPRLANQSLGGSTPAYPNPHLCGAGVAFKLAWGIGLAMNGAARVSNEFRECLLDATALAALGTIADVVPLQGENRVLAHFGLGGLRKTRLNGLRALIESAGLTGQSLDSFHVGFLLAPRLNACGRMGHARLAVEMLTSASEAKAKEIAAYLDAQNHARQAIEKQILEQALEQVAANGWDADSQRALVLGAENWHPGVIGIVASRIVERFHRPTVMLAINNGHAQGSARSISGFHLARALEACHDCLETHGGHEMAAGLKLQTARLDDFRAAFCAHAGQELTEDMLVSEIKIDAVAELRQITLGLLGDLARLGPFGHGNRRPLFVCRKVSVVSPPRRVGKASQHLQMQVRQADQCIKCIAFGQGDLADKLPPGTQIDVAVEPSINEYNGRTSVQLEIKDLQFV
jgi:single-stranded-DNA-specific exonuclease